MNNKIFKIIIDIIMTICFIVLMGYQITGNLMHEILGTITFILCIIHNILNFKWYKNIFKGKHNIVRICHMAINILLLISIIAIMISGIMISSTVFDFLNIKTTMFGRRLHMLSTSWGLIFISMHIGFHLNGILTKINKNMKNSMFEYVYYFILVLLFIFGLYSFVDLGIWKNMFLLNDFTFFDYEQNYILYYLKYFALIIFIALLVYVILKAIGKKKKEERV